MFHVFVEGAKDASPSGVQKLADAIAAHYGLPAADLRTRLAAGRFRVKGNVDRATAERYVRDLEGLGARCQIESAGGAGAPQFQSGLSAAFSGKMPAANLGALEKADSAFALASVDGSDDPAKSPPASAFAPPPPSAVLEIPTIRPSKSKVAPAPPPALEDPFAPPDAANDLAVELATDDAPAPPKRPSMPPTVTAAPLPQVVATKTSSHPLADERVRYIAGVVLAILIGFVPAHLISSIREHSAYAAIDREVEAAQQLADNPEAYARLDQVRAGHLENKKDERRSIALLAFVIWGVAGGGIAYVWFRKLRWERITGEA